MTPESMAKQDPGAVGPFFLVIVSLSLPVLPFPPAATLLFIVIPQCHVPPTTALQAPSLPVAVFSF